MWSWAVLTLFLLTACVVFGTFTAGLDISERVDLVSAEEKHRPLLTASQFYQSLIDHNYDVAHSQLAPEVAATHTPTDLRGRWQILEEASGDITLELDLKSPKIEGAKAFLNRSLVPTKGDQYDINLGMEMFNGSWRIVDATPYIIPEP
jgi:hypothetical protein